MPHPRTAAREKRQADDALQILLEEWRLCQAGIGRLDGLKFQIRGWAISLVVAVVAATVTLRQPSMAFVGVLVSVLFWISEAMYDSAEGLFIRRAEELEALLASHVREPPPFDRFDAPLISRRFKEGWEVPLWRQAWDVAKRALIVSVFFIYAALFAVCVACYFLAPRAA